MKQCTKCNQPKNPDEFGRRKSAKDGRREVCKVCHVELKRAWRLRFPERQKKLQREHRWKAKGIEIDYEQYKALLESQGGVCAICKRADRCRFALGVDHCHRTGRIRGLLCTLCNSAIGKLDDDPALLEAARQYLL